MITGSEMKALLNRFPKFEDSCIGLEYAPRLPKGIVGETKELIAYARKFNDEVIRPRVLVLDRETFEDPGYLPHDIMK
ncbi:MAG TPA: acyl-CoA dehydrogenase, partial [Deltaproteobacteria bacterium]|nr:acyl-CoA dehydrogenase [Deltaproteobacteria bacterium]